MSATSLLTSLRKPEVLAPAGEWDCVRAAVENGADAVFFGIGRFNARVRAKNFEEADLPELMAYLHGRGVKGYVTFNTLIFPDELAEAARTLRSIVAAGVDAAIVQVSPPDEHGFCSLGVEVIATKAAVEAAPIVIAMVNPRMPRTLGDTFVHVSRFTAIVEVDWPLPELKREGFGEVERRIGEHVAGLIEDGATLQMGIGAIPDAVLASLEGRRDLGVHTEMISDGVLEAWEKGLITGAKKSLHPGKIVGTFVLGSERLYRFVHDNPLFELHPADYVNDPFVIAQNRKMVAINSAIEVDLTGQVVADSIGTRIYSGFGGQLDFIRGAARSEGGKPIIALPSTAKGQSRIVPFLKPGAGVVTTRADVHYVVTEWGVAELFGRSLRERAKALIAIAHPDFREALLQGAWERGLLPRGYPGVDLKGLEEKRGRP